MLAEPPGAPPAAPSTAGSSGPPVSSQNLQWTLSEYQRFKEAEGDQVLWVKEMREGLEHGAASLSEGAKAAKGPLQSVSSAGALGRCPRAGEMWVLHT